MRSIIFLRCVENVQLGTRTLFLKVCALFFGSLLYLGIIKITGIPGGGWASDLITHPYARVRSSFFFIIIIFELLLILLLLLLNERHHHHIIIIAIAIEPAA